MLCGVRILDFGFWILGCERKEKEGLFWRPKVYFILSSSWLIWIELNWIDWNEWVVLYCTVHQTEPTPVALLNDIRTPTDRLHSFALSRAAIIYPSIYQLSSINIDDYCTPYQISQKFKKTLREAWILNLIYFIFFSSGTPAVWWSEVSN